MKCDIVGSWSGDELHLEMIIDGHTMTNTFSTNILEMIERGEEFKMGDYDVHYKDDMVFIPMSYENHYTSVGVMIDVLLEIANTAIEKNPKSKYPVNEIKWNNAIKQAKNFNMKDVTEFTDAKLDLPSNGDPVSLLGKVSGIIYMSNKEGLGENQQYIHEMKEPYPYLLLSGSNKSPTYIIFGGKTYISEQGDDSGEAPGWMID